MIVFGGGILLLLVGVVSLFSPLPGSAFFLASGGGMVICSSKRAERMVRKGRTRYPKFNKALTWIEEKMGTKISAPLRLTRPENGVDQVEGTTTL